MEKIKMIVVDDEEVITKLCKKILEREGYDVADLNNPKKANPIMKITPNFMTRLEFTSPDAPKTTKAKAVITTTAMKE